MTARKPYTLKDLPKGCTKEVAEKIDRWVTKCWNAHWKSYGPSSNYRTTFLNYALRDYKELDDAEMTRIYNAIVAQKKHFEMKAKAGDWVRGKGLGVWYNQGIYNEEFIDESAADIAERNEATSYCKCGQPVDHKGYMECWGCYERRTTEENRQDQKKLLKDLGLYKEGQSLREVSQNCREHLLQNPISKQLSGMMTSSEKPQGSGNQ